ncbi:CDP-glucose 4,6-dehydratase [Sphingobacterium anhuiense]|uniref:CDP-glucose 4,6-dehydratase n=1 Tax=Sphingobacterium anhuiense TaxID=493780 RepID=UPI003C2F7015
MLFEQLKETFRDKKVFITGHTGFKGSWMLYILSLIGANIKGYSLESDNTNNLYNVIKGDSLCDSVISDLRDRKRLSEEIISFQPDFVFHLAAQPLVRLSYEIPSETFEINAIGTANLLDGIRLLKKKCTVVLITTDKVYHNNEWDYPYRENDRLGGYDPYSASKACTELLIDSYKNSFFNKKNYNDHLKDISIMRAGNVIGGGDWSRDRLMPDIARALSSNEEILLRNPNAIRPWQHVLEPVVAYLLVATKQNQFPLEYSDVYNIGPHPADALSVREMLGFAIESWGEGKFRIEDAIKQPHEAGLLLLDISKFSNKLLWSPKWNASQAVEKTVAWYKTYHDKGAEETVKLTKEQILSYLNA